ncbi:MAG: tyrosine-type recombinase/integrase [Bifidobacterium tsurumiense]|uniref:tyrosine-type recombinase/integrase n=1 Tax=Bifidobacterium tsurumiense TaxID=356829 RepID=UPI002A802790|nr:tyrosine-type recombinase/integrase [Bifidobacterium tsurumiense]MDY4677622.1 tyrosine-type recombinase/integrase [Bifidobacterium tsurumiense]
MTNITSYETSKGQRRFRVRFRKPDGTQTDKRGFLRKKDAELWAAEHVTVAKANDSFIDPQAGIVTVGSLFERWMVMREPFLKRSTFETNRRTWNTHVAPAWKDRRLDSIRREQVQEWVSELASRRSASTTLKAHGILHAVCLLGVKERRILHSPTEGVELPKRAKRKERRRYLTVPQLLAFAEAAGRSELIPRERRALVLTLGFTGIRWGEASALKVGSIDFKAMRLHVDANLTGWTGNRFLTSPKNHEVRDVPMPRIVADALAEITAGKDAGDSVFLDPSGEPLRFQSASESASNRTWWPMALRRAGLPLMSPHDLRHTFASIAVQAGANVKALQRMMGHASASMTLDVYADLFDSDLDDVARLIDARVGVDFKCGQNVGKTVVLDAVRR